MILKSMDQRFNKFLILKTGVTLKRQKKGHGSQ